MTPAKAVHGHTYEELMLSFKRFTVKDFWVDKGENLDGNVAHFGHGVLPTVHDEGWRVGGEHNLCIGVELAHKADEVFCHSKCRLASGSSINNT